MNPEANPWKIISEKNLYNNPWIQLTEFDVINPSGGKGIYGKIHFKNRAIGVVAMDENLNIWLVGQYRFPIDQYSWEIPEGGGLVGVDPLEGAKRELLEETGLVAKTWVPMLKMHLSNSVSDELAIVYLATDLTQHTAEPEETEQLQIKKLPFETVFEMVENELITDSMTVAAVYKIKLLLLEGKLK
jgi:8-oxo-dGTP pyrophosphatase MutT (NUDIX family)